MRHRNRRGKLGRKSAHRKMMLRNMVTSLFQEERIMTTVPKAKHLRPLAEKLITLARKQDLHARRLALKYVHDKDVVKKLFDDIAKRSSNGEPGGYTRIVLHSARWGDGAPRAFLELKNAVIADKTEEKEEKKKKKAGTAKEKSSKAAKETKATKESKAAETEPEVKPKPKPPSKAKQQEPSES